MLFAGTKFSLGLSIEIYQPKFSRIHQIINDHIGLANDLGSFAREKEAFETKKVCYIFNSVQTVEDLIGADRDDADSYRAKSMTYALQLLVEKQFEMELTRLREEETLDEEEWQYVNALVFLLSGNMLCSIVLARYGGEAGKISHVNVP